MKTCMIYVDGPNTYVSGKLVSATYSGRVADMNEARRRGIQDNTFRLDYARVIDIASSGAPYKAKVYLNKRNGVMETVRELAASGHIVFPVEPGRDGKEKRLDVKLAVDMVEDACLHLMPSKHRIVLVAGDHDYEPAMRKVKKLGYETRLVWWRYAPQELKAMCDSFIPLDIIMQHSNTQRLCA